MYATRADVEASWGAGEVERWSVREGDPLGAISVASAIAHVAGRIDAALSVRFKLPLAETPEVLKAVAVDLVAARLAGGDGSQMTDVLREREKQARTDLRDIAKGELNLGLPAKDIAHSGAVLAGSGPRPVLVGPSTRPMSREALRGF
jgi:phage gp36-like protein